jgi:hypothetical protein
MHTSNIHRQRTAVLSFHRRENSVGRILLTRYFHVEFPSELGTCVAIDTRIEPRAEAFHYGWLSARLNNARFAA